MHEYNFEKLEIWKLAIQLAVNVYKTTKKFPEEEKFGLVSQLRRSASSISTNIAEGVHFLLSKELQFIDESELVFYRETINELSNKINAFYKNLKN